MSEASQGPGWWVASDGKWYPPEQAPGPVPPPPPPVTVDGGLLPPSMPGTASTASLASREEGRERPPASRSLLIGLAGCGGLLVLLLVIGLLVGNKKDTTLASAG